MGAASVMTDPHERKKTATVLLDLDTSYNFASGLTEDGLEERNRMAMQRFAELIKPSPKENRSFVKLKVKGQNKLALIDSGATRTFVGLEIREMLKDYLVWSGGMMRVADGDSVQLVGCVAPKMEMRNEECILPVRITSALAHPAVLGMDVISAMGITINGEKGVWRCGNWPYNPIINTVDGTNDDEIILVEPVMNDGKLNEASVTKPGEDISSIRIASIDPNNIESLRENLH